MTEPLDVRIGQGFDVHALVPGRPLLLGGVQIANSHGLLGHSDADCLLHAITDALLGAAGLGDIGEMFPDTQAQHKNADSLELLALAYARVVALGWQVVNLDCTVHCETPKLAQHKRQMGANIAGALQLNPELVNVKAKTNEKLGHLGRGEGIAANAVVLLRRAKR